MKKQQEKQKLTIWGSVSGALAVFLIVLTIQLVGSSHAIGYSGLSGSSMLNESAGGYVLVAIAAFAAGVVLTTLIRRYRSGKRNKGMPDSAEEQQTKRE